MDHLDRLEVLEYDSDNVNRVDFTVSWLKVDLHHKVPT